MKVKEKTPGQKGYSAWRVFIRLLGLGRPYIPWYVALCVATFILSASELGGTEALRRLVNAATSHDMAQLWGGFYLATGAMCVNTAVGLASSYYGGLLDHVSIMYLQSRLLQKLTRVRMSSYEKYHTGDLISRINDSASQAQSGVNGRSRDILSCVLTIVFTLGYLSILNVKLMVGAVLISLLVPILVNPLSRRVRQVYDARQKSRAELDSFIQDSVQGAEVVRAFSLSSRLTWRFYQKFDEILGLTRKAMWFETLIGESNFSVTIGGIIFVLGYGGILVSRGELDTGGVVAFLVSFERISWPLSRLVSMWPQFQQSIAQANRVFEILDLPEEDGESGSAVPGAAAPGAAVFGAAAPGAAVFGAAAPGAAAPGAAVSGAVESGIDVAGTALPRLASPAIVAASATGVPEVDVPNGGARHESPPRDLVFDEIVFGYDPASPVLKGISFTAEDGQVTALVGPSGCGKSTLLKLVLRLYEPTSGRILYGTDPIERYQISAWRMMNAYVSQDPYLFSGTLYENILYGRPDASRDEVEEAARIANIHDFIEATPQGYQTKIGERGVRLSGGERQRISIARAVLRNPAVLILDEPTSSLDSDSEAAVQQALNRLMAGRTTLVVAHRLSTIRDAHKIVFIEDGQIRESGTHLELMSLRGRYYAMHETARETAGLGPALRPVLTGEEAAG